MKNPDNIHDALRHLHHLTMSIATDIGNCLEDPAIYGSDFFEDVKAAALDAHMLITWIKDNLVENK